MTTTGGLHEYRSADESVRVQRDRRRWVNDAVSRVAGSLALATRFRKHSVHNNTRSEQRTDAGNLLLHGS